MSIQMINSEFIEIRDNIYMHIRDWGVGPAIVFIPGWPFGHEMFEYQFTQLPQQGYRCIGISMRGFGRSSKPWGEYSYDVFAEDIRSVLQSLALTDVTLVGFSMGGAIAIRYMAHCDGERIARLALCGAAAPNFTARPGFPFGVEAGAVNSQIELCCSDRARLIADFGQKFFKDINAVSPQLLDWFQNLAMEASPHATAACLTCLRDSDLREDLLSVKVPTILFHGVHDRICPFEIVETMTAPTEAMPAGAEAMAAGVEAAGGGIRGARVIRFDNSGHALFYEERVKFNEELIKFIENKSCEPEKFFGASTN
jgi:pimeloyl-ACP methyl ester carboxylesterase